MDFEFLVKRENEVTIEMDEDVMSYHCGIELDLEFCPVEHPVEPEDEDRPVKCPMPISSSSVINDDKTAEERREIRPDPGKERPQTAPSPRPIRVVRKRHHAFTGSGNSAAKPTIPKVSPLQPRDTSGESNVTINLIEFGS